MSGVQRVHAEVAARLSDVARVAVDPLSGGWVAAPDALRGEISEEAVELAPGDVLVLLGSSWIDQTVLLAVQRAVGRGVRLAVFLHDLTPVQEAGHGKEVQVAFRRYLSLLANCGAVVVANSQATANELRTYAQEHGLPMPAVSVSGLPPGLTPQSLEEQAQQPSEVWPRPYVLFVGTIEERKSHLDALRAWQTLDGESSGTDIPDLVCVGRWGWGCQPFQDAWNEAGREASGVYVLSDGVDDSRLADLYANALATIYPSRLEGWGLPVSESLAFGKLPITTDTSSLPEAGAGLAVLVPPGDPSALAAAVAEHVLNEAVRASHEQRIRGSEQFQSPSTWQHVADEVAAAIGQAASMQPASAPVPEMIAEKEYILGIPAPAHDPGSVRVEAIATDRGSPLLGLPVTSEDILLTDQLVHGDFAEPTTWGYPVLPGGSVEIRFTVAASSDMTLLIATAPVVGSGTVDITVGATAPTRQPLAYGEVLSIPVPASESDRVSVNVRVVAQDKDDGLPLTLQSITLLNATDHRGQVAILERIARARSVQLTEAEHKARALQEQLTGVLSSRSWRVTKPLRKLTGDQP